MKNGTLQLFQTVFETHDFRMILNVDITKNWTRFYVTGHSSNNSILVASL